MKKNFKRWIAFMLIACTMVTVAVLPSYASNLDYCFYYEKYDSADTFFGHQFFIEHTGQLFQYGYTEGEILTDNVVPTNQAMYMNLCFSVRYENNTYDHRKTYDYWDYLRGNTDYYYSQGQSNQKFQFALELVTDYVTSAASLATRASTSPSATMPSGYISPVTGETYAHTIQKTREEIFEHGHDYLNY